MTVLVAWVPPPRGPGSGQSSWREERGWWKTRDDWRGNGSGFPIAGPSLSGVPEVGRPGGGQEWLGRSGWRAGLLQEGLLIRRRVPVGRHFRGRRHPTRYPQPGSETPKYNPLLLASLGTGCVGVSPRQTPERGGQRLV